MLIVKKTRITEETDPTAWKAEGSVSPIASAPVLCYDHAEKKRTVAFF